MLKFLISLTTVSIVLSSPATETKPNLEIIGGEYIDIRDAPYQVSLVNPTGHYCGGIIVAHDIVITAAHCGVGINLNDFQIRVGSSSSKAGGVLYPIGDVIVHEGFNWTALDNDVAVIWLSKSLEFNDRVSSVDMLEENEEIKEGKRAIVTGWGYTGHVYPEILQRVEVPIVSEESCRNTYSDFKFHVTPRMLCAGISIGGKDTCNGDSGGPLVYNGKLAGVVSWGKCGESNHPGVYAKVSALRNWIDDSITYIRLKHLMGVQT